jgi:PAS domain S-box-containing protein
MLDINSIKDTIVRFIVDPLIILDANKIIRVVNEATLYLLGYREEELMGKHVEVIFTESKISILRRENAEKLIGSGTILNIETHYQTKDGKNIPILFSSSIMKDNDGSILWIACIAKDITERKKEEEELQAAYGRLKETQDQLIQAEKLNAIGLLASGVAHEVKNPLGIIIQGVNYLEAKLSNNDEDIVDTLNMIKDSVQRANKIVNTLLDFSRAKKLDLQPENINLILKNALDLVKTNTKFENINIKVEIDLPPKKWTL